MITMDNLRKVFAAKLLATNSMDAALTKALWEAFKAGTGRQPETQELLEELARLLSYTFERVQINKDPDLDTATRIRIEAALKKCKDLETADAAAE